MGINDLESAILRVVSHLSQYLIVHYVLPLLLWSDWLGCWLEGKSLHQVDVKDAARPLLQVITPVRPPRSPNTWHWNQYVHFDHTYTKKLCNECNSLNCYILFKLKIDGNDDSYHDSYQSSKKQPSSNHKLSFPEG